MGGPAITTKISKNVKSNPTRHPLNLDAPLERRLGITPPETANLPPLQPAQPGKDFLAATKIRSKDNRPNLNPDNEYVYISICGGNLGGFSTSEIVIF